MHYNTIHSESQESVESSKFFHVLASLLPHILPAFRIRFYKHLIGTSMSEKIRTLWNLAKEAKKETKVALQSMVLFLCLLIAVHLGDTARAVNSTYGDRELPIYSVKTDEKKIAISFDAAWGAEDFPKIMEVLGNSTPTTL